jgi:hypothetical protein
MSEYEYQNTRRVVFENGATFVPVCEKCFRFVKPGEVYFRGPDGEGGLVENLPNAICKRCGPTKMLFEGFYG